jgi:hypothetical protein
VEAVVPLAVVRCHIDSGAKSEHRAMSGGRLYRQRPPAGARHLCARQERRSRTRQDRRGLS